MPKIDALITFPPKVLFARFSVSVNIHKSHRAAQVCNLDSKIISHPIPNHSVSSHHCLSILTLNYNLHFLFLSLAHIRCTFSLCFYISFVIWFQLLICPPAQLWTVLMSPSGWTLKMTFWQGHFPIKKKIPFDVRTNLNACIWHRNSSWDCVIGSAWYPRYFSSFQLPWSCAIPLATIVFHTSVLHWLCLCT